MAILNLQASVRNAIAVGSCTRGVPDDALSLLVRVICVGGEGSVVVVVLLLLVSAVTLVLLGSLTLLQFGRWTLT